MELILGVAVGSFVEKSIPVGVSMKGPIEIFRESIRDGVRSQTCLPKMKLCFRSTTDLK